MAIRGWRGRPAHQDVPGWDALGLPWRETTLWVADLETTGLDLRRDEVISWAMVPIRGGRVIVADAAAGLVRPQRMPGEATITIHGILPEDLAAAPGPDQAARDLLHRLPGGALVAHSAWVETAFLGRLFGPAGARLRGPVIDTAALAVQADLARGGAGVPDADLDDLAARLALPVHARHDALGDALTTATVLLALVARLEQRQPEREFTVGDLAALSRRPR